MFYDQRNLSVKVWSEATWDDGNFSEGTVWIVKESLMVQKYKSGQSFNNEQDKTKFWGTFRDPDFK